MSHFVCFHRSCRRRSFASMEHRRYIWRYARQLDRWPTRNEWRFIIIGRWRGF